MDIEQNIFIQENWLVARICACKVKPNLCQALAALLQCVQRGSLEIIWLINKLAGFPQVLEEVI